MGYLNDIVTGIDTKLNRPGAIFGIAQQLPRISKQGGQAGQLEIIPATVTQDGEAKYIGPDDDYSYMSYHRVLGISTRKTGPGYGDSLGQDEHVVNMSYVAWVQWDKLQVANHDLCLQLQANWPETVNGATITLTDFLLNSIQIYQEETANTVPFFIRPQQYLIKVLYNIKSIFDRRCINL